MSQSYEQRLWSPSILLGFSWHTPHPNYFSHSRYTVIQSIAPYVDTPYVDILPCVDICSAFRKINIRRDSLCKPEKRIWIKFIINFNVRSRKLYLVRVYIDYMLKKRQSDLSNHGFGRLIREWTKTIQSIYLYFAIAKPQKWCKIRVHGLYIIKWFPVCWTNLS